MTPSYIYDKVTDVEKSVQHDLTLAGILFWMQGMRIFKRASAYAQAPLTIP